MSWRGLLRKLASKRRANMAGSRVRRRADTSVLVGEVLETRTSPSAAAGPFTEADGDVFSIALAGAGTMEVTLGEDGSVELVEMTGIDLTSSLSLKVSKGLVGDGLVDIEQITGDGSLKGIKAKGANLVGGGIALDGFLASLTVNDILDGAQIVTGGNSLQFSKITARLISDGALIAFGSSIGKFSAARVDNSVIAAGFETDDASTALDCGIFSAGTQIKSVGLKLNPALAGATFENSIIIAPIIGKISLPSVDAANGGDAFGVFSDTTIGSVSVSTPSFKWNPLGANDQGTGDFHVIRGDLAECEEEVVPPPVVSVADAGQLEGNTVNDLSLTVMLSAPSAQIVTVNYTTADGSATNADYVGASGVLTFLPGQTSKVIPVTILGDLTVETDDTFFLNLSSPSNATLGDDQAVATITNDDQPSIQVGDVSMAEGDAGTVDLVFLVSLSQSSPQEVTVNYSTAPGSAGEGIDYIGAIGTLTFTAGETSKPIPVAVIGDLLVESNETFLINLNNPTNAALGISQATGTILNDDSSLVSISDVSVAEGDAGISGMVFTVSLSNPSSLDVIVNYTVAAGSATSGEDYIGSGGSLSFVPGETSKTLTVFAVGDSSIESDENFYVNLTDVSNAVVLDGQGEGMIRNDDTSIGIADFTGLEGNSGVIAFNFTVSLSAVSSKTVTVQYTSQDGSASGSSDYQPTSGTITFAPGEASKMVTVQINPDFLVEPNELFFVSLSGATNALIADNLAIGTIVDDDVTMSVGGASQNEGNSGSAIFNFSVSLSASSPYVVTVDYSTADGTASNGVDYASTDGTLTFNPGETAKTANVMVNGDETVEPDETFSVILSNPTNASISTSSGPGSIGNDDVSQISIGNVLMEEGNGGTTSFDFAVTISNGVVTPVTVNYSTADGTASNASDYQAASGVLTFGAGESFKTITIVVNGDSVNEPDETFMVNLSSPGNGMIANGSGTGTIHNDDTGISVSGGSVTEGDSGSTNIQFIVTLTQASADIVTVNYTTQDSTAIVASDYVLTAGTLTFMPGVTSLAIDVSVTGETAVEADETFLVNLTDAINATIVGGPAVGTILNDDATVSIANAAILEGNVGPSNLLMTVSIPFPSTLTVTVNFTTSNITATGGDYVSQTGTATIVSGQTTGTIAIVVNGDTNSEPDELFGVTLSAPSNATLGAPNAQATILNDDGALVILDAAQLEGNSGTSPFNFTVRLQNASALTVTVSYATADFTAMAGSDYNATSGTLTFLPGVTQQTLSVTVIGDTTVETNEIVRVNLSSPTNASLVRASAAGTIQNDDTTISIADVAIAEGNSGTTSFVFNVTLSAPNTQTTTVTYATANGTALSGFDYTNQSGTVTFAGGETSKTITINVLGDTNSEPDETFFVNLSAATGAVIADNQGIGTIQNDDAILAISDDAQIEGDSGTTFFFFDIFLTDPVHVDVNITFDTSTCGGAGCATDGVDFGGATNLPLTIPAGDDFATVIIQVTGDTDFEPDELFFAGIASTNATIADGLATGSILNDDFQPLISVIGDPSGTEGNAGTSTLDFTVDLSFTSTETVTVDYATAPNSADEGIDYTGASGTLTFAPGVTSQLISIQIIGDTDVESDEMFWVTLSNAINATLLDASSVGTIENDDLPPPPTISLDTNSLTFNATEGESNPASQSFTVTNTGALGSTLDYSVSDDGGWLTVSPTIGSLASGDPNLHSVEVDTFGLTAGTYNATITITDPTATNDPQTISVTLEVDPPPPPPSVTPLSDHLGTIGFCAGGSASAAFTVTADASVTWTASFSGSDLDSAGQGTNTLNGSGGSVAMGQNLNGTGADIVTFDIVVFPQSPTPGFTCDDINSFLYGDTILFVFSTGDIISVTVQYNYILVL